LTATCAALRHPESVVPIKIQDISVGGIGFVADRGFPRSEIFRVQLFTARGTEAFTKLARVRHTRVEEDGAYFHGCAFLPPLDAASLEWLLDR
jgi:hypothetical protein